MVDTLDTQHILVVIQQVTLCGPTSLLLLDRRQVLSNLSSWGDKALRKATRYIASLFINSSSVFRTVLEPLKTLAKPSPRISVNIQQENPSSGLLNQQKRSQTPATTALSFTSGQYSLSVCRTVSVALNQQKGSQTPATTALSFTSGQYSLSVCRTVSGALSQQPGSRTSSTGLSFTSGQIWQNNIKTDRQSTSKTAMSPQSLAALGAGLKSPGQFKVALSNPLSLSLPPRGCCFQKVLLPLSCLSKSKSPAPPSSGLSFHINKSIPQVELTSSGF
ncbi:grancalcin isoform X1 [Petaurus breviceps papuanus]|uniref:grancalcin isoform X1 n=1 Tax=Petaurus breviceps papuanus TaxID=3040969 RepID=UPI0036DC7522